MMKSYFIKRYVLGTFYVLVVVGSIIVLLKYYNNYINEASIRVVDGTDNVVYATSNFVDGSSFNELELKKNVSDYVSKSNKNSSSSITYKVDNENFYFVISIDEDDYIIDKIVDTEFNVNARMNLHHVKSIEYKNSGDDEATVLRFETDEKTNYYVLRKDASYFLGSDIDRIVYKNDRFYFIYYNSKYESLRNANSCSAKLRSSIDEFSYSEYFYREGKINFFKDYYQKIDKKNYSVRDFCNSLNKKNK